MERFKSHRRFLKRELTKRTQARKNEKDKGLKLKSPFPIARGLRNVELLGLTRTNLVKYIMNIRSLIGKFHRRRNRYYLLASLKAANRKRLKDEDNLEFRDKYIELHAQLSKASHKRFGLIFEAITRNLKSANTLSQQLMSKKSSFFQTMVNTSDRIFLKKRQMCRNVLNEASFDFELFFSAQKSFDVFDAVRSILYFPMAIISQLFRVLHVWDEVTVALMNHFASAVRFRYEISGKIETSGRLNDFSSFYDGLISRMCERERRHLRSRAERSDEIIQKKTDLIEETMNAKFDLEKKRDDLMRKVGRRNRAIEVLITKRESEARKAIDSARLDLGSKTTESMPLWFQSFAGSKISETDSRIEGIRELFSEKYAAKDPSSALYALEMDLKFGPKFEFVRIDSPETFCPAGIKQIQGCPKVDLSLGEPNVVVVDYTQKDYRKRSARKYAEIFSLLHQTMEGHLELLRMFSCREKRQDNFAESVGIFLNDHWGAAERFRLIYNGLEQHDLGL